LPVPIPLITAADPIEFDPITCKPLVTLLLSIGYRSVDEIIDELAATVHTPAKTFYRMWQRGNTRDAHPWRSGASGTAYDGWEFTMSPRAFPQSGTAANQFGRNDGAARFESLQSPDTSGSFATSPNWIPAFAGDEQSPFAKVTGVRLPLADVMYGAQAFLEREQFEFFHPDDLQYIARHVTEDSEFYVNVRAEFVPGAPVGTGEMGLDVLIIRITGPSEEFDDFVEKFQAVIADMQRVAGYRE
jgi:hypothetical protein